MSAFERLHPSLQYHIVNTLGWPGLRASQLEAIDPVVSGQNALLLAPTAGGKTEAAAFPVLSRMLTEDWRGVSVLYVCPIRALLNNLEPRLAHYAGLLGRRAALWHGDVTAGDKRRVLRDLPDLLLITPESIEGMLISRRVDHRAFFAGLQAVVVDELHAFAGDDRGWHLLAVIARIERIIGRRLQRIGLSATVGNPEDLAAWLTGGRPVVVAGRSAASADAEVAVDHVGSLDNAALVISRLHRGEKRLVFCDSRGKVEQLAAGLRGHGVQTFVSHSSLGIDARRQAEDAFARERDCVIVATSTLELGIDVGDLDRVIQIDAPSTVSSLLQRMGRTGRRVGTQRNCLFLTTSDRAFLNALGIVQLWGEGYVEPVIAPPSPLHLYAQQIMALILQEGGLPECDVEPSLAAAFGSVNEDDTAAILSHMLASGILAGDGGILGIGPAGEKMFGRRNFLELVATFTTPAMITVMHGRQELGQVDPISLTGHTDQPSVLLLAGRNWLVSSIDWRRRLAWAEPAAGSGKSSWMGGARFLHFDLCRAIQRCVAGKQAHGTLSKRAATKLAEVVEEFSFLEARTQALVSEGDGIRWWTFAGGKANAALAMIVGRHGVRAKRFDDFGLDLDVAPPAISADEVELLPEEKPSAGIQREAAELKFSACLPVKMAYSTIFRRQFDFQKALEIVAERQ